MSSAVEMAGYAGQLEYRYGDSRSRIVFYNGFKRYLHLYNCASNGNIFFCRPREMVIHFRDNIEYTKYMCRNIETADQLRQLANSLNCYISDDFDIDHYLAQRLVAA